MAKASMYDPVMEKLKKEKSVTLKTAFPTRVRNAVIKRKHVTEGIGRLSFNISATCGEEDEEGRPLFYISIVLSPPTVKSMRKFLK